MSVIRVEKTKDYSVISNYHLRDKNLSLKAKGLLSVMLSLPDNWDYSILGLAEISKEGEKAIRAVLHELERESYLERKQLRDKKGYFIDWEYVIYERKQESDTPKTPHADYPHADYPHADNGTQLNTNILSTNKPSTKSFKRPTLEEVKNYCQERNNQVDPQAFYDFYESKGWMVGSNKMKDWKACVRTWERRNRINTKSTAQKKVVATPEWYGKEQKRKEGEAEEIKGFFESENGN